jgi:co-chaperonin GroES (HSP10)
MNIQMMGNRVLVELVEEKMQLGMHLPDGYSDERKGKVVALGNGRKLKNGRRVPIEGINIGDVVLLPNGLGPGARAIDMDGKTYWSIVSDELLGVLEK